MQNRRALLLSLAKGEAVPKSGGTGGTGGTVEQCSTRKPPVFHVFHPFHLENSTSGKKVEHGSREGGTETVDSAAVADDLDGYEERAAICEHEGGLSPDHAEQLATLHAMPIPAGISEEQRAVVIDAAARFLDCKRRATSTRSEE